MLGRCVFMGACEFNLSDYASSEHYYDKATRLDKDHVLAWQVCM